MRIEPVFLFDLDGTPVDSVYQHALAWKAALDAEGYRTVDLIGSEVRGLGAPTKSSNKINKFY